MPPRATWKGHLKLSLVSLGVRVYNATSSASRVGLNQLHKDCHQRLKQKLVCPEHGDVERSEIEKGYEFEKGRYVVIDEEDLERIQIATTKTIEIVQFVDRDELDPIFLNAPYYVAPDGPVAEEAYRVIRAALQRTNKVGIGRFVVGGREHVVVLDVKDDGLLMTTLRSDAEVRASHAYFEEVRDGELDDDQLKLAEMLIENHVEPLDTSKFKDRYQEALLDVIKAKIDGRAPAVIQDEAAPPSFNFMDALRASVEQAEQERTPAVKSRSTKKKTTRKKPPAKSVTKKRVTKKKKA